MRPKNSKIAMKYKPGITEDMGVAKLYTSINNAKLIPIGFLLTLLNCKLISIRITDI